MKAPGATPKNFASSSAFGTAPNLTAMKGLAARALAAWMPCASISLPVPVSPSSSTVPLWAASFRTPSASSGKGVAGWVVIVVQTVAGGVGSDQSSGATMPA